jgi:hypothetical protein
MSIVAITATPPGGSPSDITTACVFSRCTFTSQFNGVPGSFDIFVRDPARTLSFATGTEIKLTVDGVAMFGGYVTTVGMTSFAPAADTSNISTYDLRAWHLTGPDYNIAFDRRVFRNTGDYLDAITISSNVDGTVLSTAIGTYADMSDFSTAGITTIATIPDVTYVTIQQGWPIRKEFETLLPFSGAVYYIDGNKVIQYKAYDNVVKRWGFSDAPNHAAITVSPDAYQSATYGFSSVEATEDANQMANDVFAWGGSEFAGAGGTVFYRATDATSVTTYGRWQHAETHFGETLYKSTAGVTAVATAILDGPPGTDATGQEKGLKNPQWTFTFQWNSDQVPLLSGVPDHIIAGDLVTIDLTVFGVTKLLPLRQMTISFPDAFIDPSTDDRVVHFEGTFGLQLSDSFTLWRYIMQNQSKTVVQTQAVVTSSSTTTTYGASFSGAPTPATDGSTVLFTLPFGYISGTLQVYLDGLIQRPTTDFVETDNVAGTFTMTSAPKTTDNLECTMFTLA